MAKLKPVQQQHEHSEKQAATAATDEDQNVTGTSSSIPRLTLPKNELGHVADLVGHKGPVLAVSTHPTNASVVATASLDCTVRVWRTKSDMESVLAELLAEMHQNVPILHSAGGNVKVSAETMAALSSQLSLAALQSGTCSIQLSGHEKQVNAVSFFVPDGHSVASASHDETVRLVCTPISTIALSTIS